MPRASRRSWSSPSSPPTCAARSTWPSWWSRGSHPPRSPSGSACRAGWSTRAVAAGAPRTSSVRCSCSAGWTWSSRARTTRRPASTPRCSRSLARRSERAHRVREAGDRTGGAVAVLHALGHRLVELARGPRQRLGGSGRVARRDRRAYRAHQVAEMGLQRPVAQPALLALPMALERRGMVRHADRTSGGRWYHARRGGSNALDRLPQPVALRGGDVGERLAAYPRRRLEAVNPRHEAVVGGAERHLRRHLEVPAEARGREQEVAQLVLDRGAVAGRERGLELRGFLAQLLEYAVRVGPVETDVARLLAQLLGAHQRRRRCRHAREEVAVLARRAPLLGLDAAPVAHHLARVAHLDVAEDVGVAADELVGDRARHLGDREAARLGRELGLEDDLEEEIAELVAQVGSVPGIDRLEHLVDLLEKIGAEAHGRLLAVPRAAARAAEPRHQVHQARERLGDARIGHRATVSAGLRAVNACDAGARGLASTRWRASSCTPRRAARSACARSGCWGRAACPSTRSTWAATPRHAPISCAARAAAPCRRSSSTAGRSAASRSWRRWMRVPSWPP